MNRIGDSSELKGKPVKVRHGPATVTGRTLHEGHWVNAREGAGNNELESGDLPISGTPIEPSMEREVDVTGAYHPLLSLPRTGFFYFYWKRLAFCEVHPMEDTKELRKGITTGASAAAAAQAAVILLFENKEICSARVFNPGGKEIIVPIHKNSRLDDTAEAVVIKDGGDDFDITHGMEVRVQAFRTPAGIKIRAGEGIGIVTKEGLQVPVGEPAINPVPRQMITSAVASHLPEGAGVELTVSVPGGAEAARKTLNPKLGIINGISILGTTGIVEPMSEEAFKNSLAPQIAIALAAGHTSLCLVPGRLGENWAVERLGVPPDAVVQMSNFVGFMLNACVKMGVRRVLLAGHHSKLAKVAAGCFHTHNKISDARLEVVAALAGTQGASPQIIKDILAANTSDEAYGILLEHQLEHVMELVAERATAKAKAHVFDEIEMGVCLFDMKGRVLAEDAGALEIRRSMGWQEHSQIKEQE